MSRRLTVTRLGLMDLYNAINYNVEYEFEAWVTHIVDPNEFYIRHVDYDEYLPLLRQRGKKLLSACSDVEEEMKVIVKLKSIDGLARGTITSFDKRAGVCSALAVDYGYEEHNIPLNTVFLPKEIIYSPGLAIKCVLADFKPSEQAKDLSVYTAKLKKLIKNQKVKLIVRKVLPFNNLVVSVKLLPNKTDVANVLNKMRIKVNKDKKAAQTAAAAQPE